MTYEEYGGCVLAVAPLTFGAGVMELAGGKAKCPGFFVEVLRDNQRFREVYRINRDNVDNLECRYIFAP